MTLQDLLKLKKEILKITASCGCKNVRVFGSMARGEAKNNSDVDILVKFNPGTSLIDHSRLKRMLEELLASKVDVVDEDELDVRLRDQVLKEAVSL